MKRRRTRITIAVVAVVVLLLAGAVYLRATAPPEVARLLPESDGIIYLNLGPLRAATHFDRTKVPHSPGYQKFINATGIVFERDLNQVAFALERMPNPKGPNGPVAYSEVFEGRFNGKRLKKYLSSIATARKRYAGHTIYEIPNDGRTDRVTLLGYNMVAVSNTPTAEQIHSIVERYRTAALPFTGSSLLAAHYREVPLLSLAWGIGKIGLPFSGSGKKEISLDGVELPVAADATLIASVRWVNGLKLRAVEIAGSVENAAATAQSLESVLGLLHAAEGTPPGQQMDPNVKALLNSAKVRQKKDQVVVTASIPEALVQAMLTPERTPAAEAAPAKPATKATPAKKP